jgi:hypothetical protein
MTESESASGRQPTVYRLARAHSVGVLGRFAVGTGLVVVGAVLATTLTEDVPDVAAGALLIVLAAGLALTFVAALRVLRPPVVLELTDTGYRLRVVRGSGTARQAAWAEVAKVRRQRLAPGTCLVLSLGDGARTVVPLALLEGGAETGDRLETDLRSRLDRSHGQRRLT